MTQVRHKGSEGDSIPVREQQGKGKGDSSVVQNITYTLGNHKNTPVHQ